MEKKRRAEAFLSIIIGRDLVRSHKSYEGL